MTDKDTPLKRSKGVSLSVVSEPGTARTTAAAYAGHVTEFRYADLLPIGTDETPYRLLTTEGEHARQGPDGRTFLQVAPRRCAC